MARRGARMYIWRSPSHGCALSQNNMFQKQVSRQRDPRLPPRSTLHHHPAIAWFGCNSHVALTKPLSALTHAYSQQHLNTSPATPSRESSTPRLNMLPHAFPLRHPEPDHPSPISTSYRLLVSRAQHNACTPPPSTSPQHTPLPTNKKKSATASNRASLRSNKYAIWASRGVTRLTPTLLTKPLLTRR
jgi:hypothetical protein